jgi:flagellar basal-body rod modification protein FlgD
MTTIDTSAAVSNDLMAAVNPKKKAASTDTVQADTDKFLNLLITQLKNQDPSNPLDNAQLTSQLAQMSTVTGINKLNDTLAALQGSYQQSETMQAANMINHGVLSQGTSLSLANKASVFGVELASAADSVKVEIYDKTNKLVETLDLGALPAGVKPLGWDGSIADTNLLDTAKTPGQAADGEYTFKVVATRGGEPLKDANGLAFGVVASVSTGTEGVKLNVPAVGTLTMADVKQIL